jgi:hypothetical protein
MKQVQFRLIKYISVVKLQITLQIIKNNIIEFLETVCLHKLMFELNVRMKLCFTYKKEIY